MFAQELSGGEQLPAVISGFRKDQFGQAKRQFDLVGRIEKLDRRFEFEDRLMCFVHVNQAETNRRFAAPVDQGLYTRKRPAI